MLYLETGTFAKEFKGCFKRVCRDLEGLRIRSGVQVTNPIRFEWDRKVRTDQIGEVRGNISSSTYHWGPDWGRLLRRTI